MASGTRSYGQMCPIARSLDVVGERWSLLIVRELLLGPKRFKDLLGELPAMGTNRLSDRLKALEADGVIAKATLPRPARRRSTCSPSWASAFASPSSAWLSGALGCHSTNAMTPVPREPCYSPSSGARQHHWI